MVEFDILLQLFIVLPANVPSTMLLEVFLFWDTDCDPQYGYISLKQAGWPCTGFRSPGRVAQSVGHLTRKSGILGSIPGLATYFRFSFRFFKKGSCQLLAKV